MPLYLDSVEENDKLWKSASTSISKVPDSLDKHIIIECGEKLYNLGELSKTGYTLLLKKLINDCGYDFV